jgi:excisionase family DNA binding protein
MSAIEKTAELVEFHRSRLDPTPDLAPRNQEVAVMNFTMKQAGQRLGLSPETIRRWIRDGKIKVRRFGRAVRISLNEIERIEREAE